MHLFKNFIILLSLNVSVILSLISFFSSLNAFVMLHLNSCLTGKVFLLCHHYWVLDIVFPLVVYFLKGLLAYLNFFFLLLSLTFGVGTGTVWFLTGMAVERFVPGHG